MTEINNIPIDPNNILDGNKFVKIFAGVKHGFSIDTNEMIIDQWYFFVYRDDKYYMVKDKDGTLNMGTDINY